MDGSDDRLSSTSPPNRSPSPSVPKGSVENSQINEEIMESNAPNQKKSRPPPKKHFMSPTISAASKANHPLKKSLVERNESIDTTPLQKTQNFDSKAAEFGENKQNPLADSLSASSPYDPLTNYLSPRPRFLRYDPNRRLEILLRRQNGIKNVNGCLSVSGSRSFSSKKVLDGEEDTSSSCGSLYMQYPEDDMNQEVGETNYGDEEIEQWAEEEKGWGLRGVLRFLLLLVVLVLSTSYISSMNFSNPSPVVQAVDGFRNGYHMFHDHVHGFVKSLESGNYSLVKTEGTSMYFAPRIGVKEMIEDVKMTEGVENSDGFIENECALSEVMDIVEHEEDRAIGELAKIVDAQCEDNEFVSHSEILEAGEVSDNVEVNSDSEGMGAVGTSESAFMLYGFNPRIIVSDTADMNYNGENEAANESQEQEVIGEEMGATGNSTDNCEECEAPIDGAEDSFYMLFQYQDILKSLLASLLAVAVSYPIFFTLFSYLDSMSKRNAKKQSTSGSAKSCSEPKTGQKCDSVPVDAEDKHIEHSVSIMNSGSLINSVEGIYQSKAPSIELLREFVVEEMCHSVRSCSMKSRLEKCTDNKTRSVLAHEQPDFSEILTKNSPSHGTFTDEKIIVKKPKDGAAGEDRKVATTPVRRSSRIRKRPIVSW